MKNLFFVLFALCTTFLFAQEYHWTAYNFSLDVEDIEIVEKLTGDYFGVEGNKAEGVTVYLFENHFNDNSINFTHSFVFVGSLDAIGAQYGQKPSDKWKLFISKINQYTKSHSSAAGKSLASFGEVGAHPIQNLYWLKVDDQKKFLDAFKKYHSKHSQSDRRVTLGSFGLGRSPHGETNYVLVGVNDFKTAMSSRSYLKNDKTAQAAWKEYRENTGEISLVRSTTRVMLGKW